jgi:hypothetical protein
MSPGGTGNSRSGSSLNLRPGERVRHADFGEGVVISSPIEGFIKVFFPSGERQLPVAGLTSALGRSELVVLNAMGDAMRALRAWLCYQAHALPLMDNVSSLTSAKIDLLPHQVVLTHRLGPCDNPTALVEQRYCILRRCSAEADSKRAQNTPHVV